MPDEARPAQDGSSSETADATRITQDLVDKVTEKVYAMLMQDLAIERERNRPSSIRTLGTGGGW